MFLFLTSLPVAWKYLISSCLSLAFYILSIDFYAPLKSLMLLGLFFSFKTVLTALPVRLWFICGLKVHCPLFFSYSTSIVVLSVCPLICFMFLLSSNRSLNLLPVWGIRSLLLNLTFGVLLLSFTIELACSLLIFIGELVVAGAIYWSGPRADVGLLDCSLFLGCGLLKARI